MTVTGESCNRMRLVLSCLSKSGLRILGLGLCVAMAACLAPGCARGKEVELQTFPTDTALRSSTPSIWPIDGGRCRISSPYGMRVHPVTGKRKLHSGIDLAASEGTPVLATADGAVISSECQRGYGNIVILRHGADFETAYAHLRKRLVLVGEKVLRGKCIGQVGRTGNATGPHLHYEVRVHGKTTDPKRYLP